MSETALTVETLNETPLVVAKTGFTGANPDVSNGNEFVNSPDGKTFLVVNADGHDDTIIATISANSATLQTERYGEVDLDDIVLTLANSVTDPQSGFVRIPPGYNDGDGKIQIAWTSGGGAWDAGEVKVAILHLAD